MLSPLLLRLAYCGQAPEPRVREVDQGPTHF
jgi:hypothetical protein